MENERRIMVYLKAVERYRETPTSKDY